MKILLVAQWYKPIKGAGAKRAGKIAHVLSQMGHEITVLTGMPSYPTGFLEKKYHYKLWAKETDGKIKIIRTYEYPASSNNLTKRLINMFSFVLSSCLAAFLMPKQNLVIVSSPPVFNCFPGWIVSRLYKTPFYFDVRDIWPDALIDIKALYNQIVATFIAKISNFFYRYSYYIFTATPHLKDLLKIKGIEAEKIKVIINSVDTELFCVKNISRKPYGFSDSDFIVTFVGNHSRAYDLKNVLKGAKLLTQYPKIKFWLIGEGEEKENLVKMARKNNLRNVIFTPEQTPEELSKILNVSDATLISLIKQKNFLQTIPSKTSEYAACAKPILASIEGDVQRYIEKYKAGIIYPAGDCKSLAKAILKLYRNPTIAKTMGKNARRLALDIFSDKTFAESIDKIFN